MRVALPYPWLVALVLGALSASPACEQPAEPSPSEGEEVRLHAARAEPAAEPPAPLLESEAAAARCSAEWDRLMALEALPGAPELEQRRLEILARAPSTPVVFLRAPVDQEPPSEATARLRKVLSDGQFSGKALSQVLRQTRMDLPLRRSVLLREGYLYAETPGSAMRLGEVLRFDHLFDEPELVVERGGERFVLERRKKLYVHPEVTTEGARLLLFDRVGLPDERPTERLHFSLRQLAVELGFSSVRVERLTAEGALVELDYSGAQVRAVLDLTEAEAKLRCQLVAAEEAAAVAFFKDWSLRRQKAVAPLLAAVDTMVDEGLPFDEPKTEIGQQDGQLRPAWITAYRRGANKYEFNGDEYPVYDWRGHPRVPQVCVDFITDGFERASGGWWAGRGEPRRRLPGSISFRKLDIENTRSVESLARFAWATPEWFDVTWLSRSERIPFRKRREFFEHLALHAERYLPGDVVIIYGLRSDDRNHYHSFFVYESDPVSGGPILVAANAGRPRIRNWEAEMRNAPKRTIVARLRPRLAFLETLLSSEKPMQPPRRFLWLQPQEEGPEQERDDVSAAEEAEGAGPG